MGSAQVQGMLWGAAAQDWAAFQEATSMPLWTDVLRAAGAGHGIRILDAGCGAGGASVLAAQLGCNVTGADASPALLTIARQRLPAARFEEADIEALPFADGVFDAVLSVNSVMYASDMGAAVKELARVTAPGGRVVITSWGPPEKRDVAGVFEASGKTVPNKPPSQAGFQPYRHGDTKNEFAVSSRNPDR